MMPGRFLVGVIVLCCVMAVPGLAHGQAGTDPGAEAPPELTPVPTLTILPDPVPAPAGQDDNDARVIRPKTVDENGELTPVEEKLSTALLLVTNESSYTPGGDGSVSNTGLLIKTVPVPPSFARSAGTGRISSGRLVYVYISMKPGYSTHAVDALVADVTNRDEENRIVSGWVDIANLQGIAELEGVQNVRQVIPPRVNIGSVTTQGDIVHRTASVRSRYGYTGAGMKIGIISNGVDHLADSQATGDLPANVHVLGNAYGGDEGTAMLEIVHDMVPDAELYFHDLGGNKLAFNEAIADLKNAGCTVICDDVGWTDEPFFEDGIIAANVSTLVSTNRVVYVSSAGNSGDSHFQGAFFDDGTGYHDFSGGTAPVLKSLYVYMPANSTTDIVLEWDDQFGHSGNDYNLYLSNYSHVPFTYGDLGFSENVQSGTGDPLEIIEYNNTGSSVITGRIDVKKFSGATKTLEVYVFGTYMYPNNNVPDDAVWGHPAVPDVVAVGAVNWSTPSTIEDFSSRGPVTIAYPVAESRPKPDITGVDGVNVTGAGGFHNPFFGTSASAPHVAAIVAQIWGAHPDLTPGQVRSALYRSAADRGTPGWDPTFGYGLADALGMAGLTLPVVSDTSGSDDDRPVVVFSTMEVPRTEIVNVGGGSAVTRATMTGTGLGKTLVITAFPKSRSDLPASIAPPPTTVYQFLSITSGTITGVVSETTLEFSVPASWLAEHGFLPEEIVMMHYADGTWQTLDTRVVSRKDGMVMYETTTPGFSYFAIAYRKSGTDLGPAGPVPPQRPVVAAVTNVPAPAESPAAPVTTPSATQTAVPAPVVTPDGGIPLAVIIAGVVCAIAIIAGAFFVRRWWIRRQNPALFREYD